MDDIFTACREGKTNFVRQFLDNIENDLNEGDDHGFTPLHWAAREGKLNMERNVFWITRFSFISNVFLGLGSNVAQRNPN